MALTFQPGHAVTVVIGVADTTIGPTAATADYDYGPAELTKPLLGSTATAAIAGQASGTFSIAGHTTEENIGDLHTLQNPANQPASIEITFNATGDKAAFNGVGRVGIQAAGDGEVDWTFAGTIAGEVNYTPGV